MAGRLRQQPKVKTNVAPILVYGGSIAALATFVVVGLNVYFNFAVQEQAKAMSSAVFHSRANGEWQESGVWDKPDYPQHAQKVVIQHGHTVSLNTTVGFQGDIDVYGQLIINGGKLKLDGQSKIILHEGSQLISKGGEGVIKIAHVKWQGEAISLLTIPNLLTSAGALGDLPLQTKVVGLEAEVGAKRHISLSWKTFGEKNSHFFEVQRSQDGIQFEALAQIEGAGDDELANSYHYLDVQPFEGTNLYRIKQISFDGTYEYAKILEVKLDHAPLKLVDVVPVQEQKKLRIIFDAGLGEAEYYLKNRKGQVLKEGTIATFRGNNHFELQKTGLPHGMYTFAMRQKQSQDKEWKKKFIFITN